MGHPPRRALGMEVNWPTNAVMGGLDRECRGDIYFGRWAFKVLIVKLVLIHFGDGNDPVETKGKVMVSK